MLLYGFWFSSGSVLASSGSGLVCSGSCFCVSGSVLVQFWLCLVLDWSVLVLVRFRFSSGSSSWFCSEGIESVGGQMEAERVMKSEKSPQSSHDRNVDSFGMETREILGANIEMY